MCVRACVCVCMYVCVRQCVGAERGYLCAVNNLNTPTRQPSLQNRLPSAFWGAGPGGTASTSGVLRERFQDE